ncbi:f-box only protein [Nesidiocoris tenuis]|uniref:F-box only protein n=1 Tax=Nesidiocoris tenuis TaxID=355587 RepID=A0ABN7A9I7_9HEMI|nr:f-box only protein [Nesidiocoris tenuis]
MPPEKVRHRVQKRKTRRAADPTVQDVAQVVESPCCYDLRRRTQPPRRSSGLVKAPRSCANSPVGGNSIDIKQDAHIESIPDEILLIIFSYLSERDLCRASRVCKRFGTLANDECLWRRLYCRIFTGCDHLNLGTILNCCRRGPISSSEPGQNRWKNGMRRLYRGINVRVILEPYVVVPKITLE